jgi:hypothetical protein
MIESAFWRATKAGLDPRFRLWRIENSVGPGTPDVFFLERSTGATGWLELKSIKEYPARATTAVFGSRGLRADQKPWIHEYWWLGGSVWILARVDRDRFLVPGLMAQSFNEMTRDQLAPYLITAWDVPLVRSFSQET